MNIPPLLQHDLLLDIIHDKGPDILERMRQCMPPNDVLTVEKAFDVLSKALKHYHVNNGEDDFCKQCGLYLTHPVHIRG